MGRGSSDIFMIRSLLVSDDAQSTLTFIESSLYLVRASRPRWAHKLDADRSGTWRQAGSRRTRLTRPSGMTLCLVDLVKRGIQDLKSAEILISSRAFLLVHYEP
jgi:hypothetical protein